MVDQVGCDATTTGCQMRECRDARPASAVARGSARWPRRPPHYDGQAREHTTPKRSRRDDATQRQGVFPRPSKSHHARPRFVLPADRSPHPALGCDRARRRGRAFAGRARATPPGAPHGGAPHGGALHGGAPHAALPRRPTAQAAHAPSQAALCFQRGCSKAVGRLKAAEVSSDLSMLVSAPVCVTQEASERYSC